MKQIPIYDATAPVVCTIGSDEIPERVELIERLRQHLDRIERTAYGLVLHYVPDPDVEADLRHRPHAALGRSAERERAPRPAARLLRG
jgi:hypothetical protein